MTTDDQAELGRVRVYPTYTFPVHQSGDGGIGLDQTITVTDWRKQGRAWAEAEARRQVTEALGAPSDTAPGGAWWMGRPARDTHRWTPVKGTPRGALPVDPDTQPAWKPDRGETAQRQPGPDPARVAEPVDEAFPPSNDEAEAAMLADTPAAREDRRPPAEQAERYDERRRHHLEQRGDVRLPRRGYRAHAAGCTVCTDIDAGGDGVGRKLRVVPPPAPAGGGEQYPVRFTFAGDEDEVRHWAWETVADALRDHVAAYVIPDDGTGVLDVDAFIASIGGFMHRLHRAFDQVAEHLGDGPVHAVVVAQLRDFSTAISAMADDAAQVYEMWFTNEDNAHDLRRAWGEIPGAHLFNVGA